MTHYNALKINNKIIINNIDKSIFQNSRYVIWTNVNGQKWFFGSTATRADAKRIVENNAGIRDLQYVEAHTYTVAY